MTVNRAIHLGTSWGGSAGVTLSLGAGGVVSVATQPASFTVTGLNGGTNFPANSVVVVGFYEEDASSGLSSPTIGGQSATLIASDPGSRMFLYSVLVGGSSIPDTIGGANGNFYTNLSFRAWILIGASSATPTSTLSAVAGGADPQILSGQPLVVPTNGVGLVMFGSAAIFTAGTTLGWGTPSGATAGDAFSRLDAHYLVGTWNTTAAGNWDPGVTGSNSLAFLNNAMIGVAYSP